MLSNHEFVWAGYDIIQTRYIEDCIGARVVSNDLFLTEICRHKGRRHDDKTAIFSKILENCRKSVKMNDNHAG